MSNGLYGMETAAENYFGKRLPELSLPQTALLAGMPQAPSAYDPYQYPEQAKNGEILFYIPCYKTRKSLNQNMMLQ